MSSDGTICDKYKSYTVNAQAGPGGYVNPASQTVMHGQDAEINIIPEDKMAVDTIEVNGDVYTNNGKED